MIENNPASKKHIIIGIVSILSLLFLFLVFGKRILFNLSGAVKLDAAIFFETRLFYWISLGLLWLYCIKIEKLNLLLWEEKKYHFKTALKYIFVILLVLFGGSAIIQLFLHFTGTKNNSEQLTKMAIIFVSNKWLLLFSCITAGIVEELIFRGYLLPRLTLLLKNPAWAIVVSSLLFGLLHAGYGTVAQILGPIFIGAVFGYFYWKYRNIRIFMIVHFLWDLLALLALTNQSGVLKK